MTLADIVAALAPGLVVSGAEGVPVSGVCVDSRQATPGCLFVALRGERSDGHAYVGEAYARGATVALVERPVEGATLVDTVRGSAGGPLGAPSATSAAKVAVIVPDALQGLQRLAQARRLAQSDLRVIGVTGSLGKTTTKEAIAAVLAQRYTTLKSPGNYNNEIGLPLTLMALEPEHQRAVLEMGMYALGEIAALCRLARPQVGVVTHVLPVHLERLGSIECVAQAKAELIEALPEGGLAVLNGDDPRVRAMAGLALVRGGRVVTFGLEADNTVRAVEIQDHGLAGVSFVAQVASERWPLEPRRGLGGMYCIPLRHELVLATLGQHMVRAALAAVSVGLAEGLDWPEIQHGLTAQGQGVRLVSVRGPNGSTLLDDSYNASPTSTVAALGFLASLPGRHLAVLGDMLELGAGEEDGHRAVGRCAAQGVEVLLTVGQRARLIAAEAIRGGLPETQVHVMDDNASASDYLAGILREGDILLVKGSRGMAMEAIVRALEDRSAEAGA